MSGAEEIWRASAERARTLDLMRQTDEALRLLEETRGSLARQRDGNVVRGGPVIKTSPLGMPPRTFTAPELTEAEMDYVRQSWEEAMARARRQRPGNPGPVLGYERDGQPIPEPAPPPPPPPDIETETRALLAEPGFLTENQFPQYDAVPAGCCTHCHGPMEPGRSGNCIYCFTLAGMGPVPPRPPVHRTRDLSGIRSPVLIIAAGAMLIAAAHWTPWLVIPAVILFAAGCLWRVKR